MFAVTDNLLIAAMISFWLVLLWRTVARDVKQRRERFASSEMLRRITGHKPTRRPIYKWIMMAAAIFLFAIALARPQGEITREALTGEGFDLIVALDVSWSMKAEDVGGNSRLDVAKALIRRLIQDLPNDRVGLNLFAGESVVASPLTFDKNTFVNFLERADPAILHRHGTDIPEALKTAMNRFDMTAPQARAILLVSDGENHNEQVLKQVLNDAVEREIKIFTLGIGSYRGAPIPEGRNVWGEPFYKTHQGRRVISKFDDSTLKLIAQKTSGEFFRVHDVSSANSIASVLNDIKRVAVVSGTRVTRREMFQYPLVLAFVILLFEWMFSDRITYERERDHWLKRI